MSKVVSAIIFMLTMLEEPFSRHGKSTSFHIHFGPCFGPCFDPSAPVSQYGMTTTANDGYFCSYTSVKVSLGPVRH